MISSSLRLIADTTYSYNITTTTSHSSGGVVWVLLLVGLVLAVVMVVSMWKVFLKAHKHGWAAIIPIYDTWTVYEMGGLPGWLAIIGLIPIVGSIVAIVCGIIAGLRIAKDFGKSAVFGVILLFFLPFIGWPILAFGKAQYKQSSDQTPPTFTPPAAPVADTSFTPPTVTPTPTNPPVVSQPPTPPQPTEDQNNQQQPPAAPPSNLVQ